MGGVDVAKILPGRSADNKFGFSFSENIFFLRAIPCFLNREKFSLRFWKIENIALEKQNTSMKKPKKVPLKYNSHS